MIFKYFCFVFSLQSLAAFISGKMRTMAAMFGIDEEYITNVSSTIQNSVAKVGFGKVNGTSSLSNKND
jgi:hypothetical protein